MLKKATDLKKLQFALEIANECDFVPNQARRKTEKDLISVLKKHIVPELSKKNIENLCDEFSNQSAFQIKEQIKLVLADDLQFQQRISEIRLGVQIANSLRGYCLGFTDFKKVAKEKYNNLIKSGVKTAMIKKVCDEFIGERSDEISRKENRLILNFQIGT